MLSHILSPEQPQHQEVRQGQQALTEARSPQPAPRPQPRSTARCSHMPCVTDTPALITARHFMKGLLLRGIWDRLMQVLAAFAGSVNKQKERQRHFTHAHTDQPGSEPALSADAELRLPVTCNHSSPSSGSSERTWFAFACC